MSKIILGGRTMPCCAAPPRPDPAEPPCNKPADDRFTWDVDGIRFAFCSAACRQRFLNHEPWAQQIAADIRDKL